MGNVQYIYILLVALLAGCGNGQSVDSSVGIARELTAEPMLGRVEWLNGNITFAKCEAGENLEMKYGFRNIGPVAIKIEEVKPSCRCVTPYFTMDPVMPDDSGWVLLRFFTTGQSGLVNKSATVQFTNTDPQKHLLTFNGEVLDGKD